MKGETEMNSTRLLALLALFLLTTTVDAATFNVHAGDDLQGAINNAAPGDTLILDAGATFNGPITLGNKTGSGYITIESSALAFLPDAVHRVTPDYAGYMPNIVAAVSGQPALRTDAGASHYKLIGIAFSPASPVSDFVFDLIELGSASQTQLSDVPHDLMLDRCLITAYPNAPSQNLKRGIELDSSDTTIANSYIAGFKSTHQDAQAIAGFNGPGPFHIINNYLEATGENLMFGGGGNPPAITGLVPADIEIRGNDLYKQPAWRSGSWVVKNLFELKSARRVLFEGNTLQNCWRDNNVNDTGYGAISLTASPSDSGAWATVEDVTIRNNVMSHTQSVFNILGNPAYNESGKGVTIENNLFWDISWPAYGNDQFNDSPSNHGSFVKISQMPNVTVDHNTVDQSGNIVWVYGGALTGFVFTNNIVNYNSGIAGGDGTTLNNQTIQNHFPNVTLSRNIMIGGDSSFPDNYYPQTPTAVYADYPNHNYRLPSNSPYNTLATDGKAIGANIDRIGVTWNSSTQVQFSAPAYNVGEGDIDASITVTRSGDSSVGATVGYATSDSAGLNNCNLVGTGIASSRCDYETTIGTLQFAPGETSKTIFIPIVDDSYVEGNESFSITLSNPTGVSLGLTSSATVTIIDNDVANEANPIDDTAFFVRQQYRDFLSREPEPTGYQGWQNILNNCPPSGVDANGNHCDRIEVSADFFRSDEFQQRGYFIYRFYKVLPGVSDPNNPQFGHIPSYHEFMPDFAKVSGFLSADQLEANKVDFVNEFMSRGDFQATYGSISAPDTYVTALLQTVGLQNHPTKQFWIDSLTNGSMTRAQVLRALVESTEMYQKNYTEAFVIMEYFGYLRRDADGSYASWIQIMNQNGGDYRIMVNGFMNSAEYRQRFGPN
jgi:hypothetical protein